MRRSNWSLSRLFSHFSSGRKSKKGQGGRYGANKRRTFAMEPLEERTLLSVCTWDGGGADDNWYTPANWVGDARPSAGDELVFAGTVRTDTNNDYTADTEFASITIEDDDFTLGGNRIELTGDAYDLGISVDTGVTGAEIELDIVLDDTVDVDADGELTISGDISGSYGMESIGDDTLTLTGTNTYTGNTTITAGTLEIGDGTTDGSIVYDIIDNSELVFNNTSYLLYEGDISGTGDFLKDAAGTLQITGDMGENFNSIEIEGGELLVGTLESVFTASNSINFNIALGTAQYIGYVGSEGGTFGNLVEGVEDGSLSLNTNGVLSWNPDNDCETGTYTLVATYTDSGGLQSKVFTLNIEDVNLPPCYAYPSTYSGLSAIAEDCWFHPYEIWYGNDTPVSFSITAWDREDTIIEDYSLIAGTSGLPANASIDFDSQTNQWVFSGTLKAADVDSIYEFDIVATDSGKKKDIRHFIMPVKEAVYSNKPHALDWQYRSMEEDSTPVQVFLQPQWWDMYGFSQDENPIIHCSMPLHGSLTTGDYLGEYYYTPEPGYRGKDCISYWWEYTLLDYGGQPVCRTATNAAKYEFQVGKIVDIEAENTYYYDPIMGDRALIEVGETSTTTLTLENPRHDDCPVDGYWTLTFPSNIRVFSENGSEVISGYTKFLESGLVGEKEITLEVEGVSSGSFKFFADWNIWDCQTISSTTTIGFKESHYGVGDAQLNFTVVGPLDDPPPDVDECDCSCACPVDEEKGDLLSGDNTHKPASANVAGISVLAYNSQEDSQPSVAVDYAFDDSAYSLDYLEVYLTFDDEEGDHVYYEADGYSFGDTVHVALLADATELDSGHYDYTISVVEHYTNETTSDDFDFDSTFDYVSRTDSEFGKYWWLDELDQLVIENDGALLIEGDGTAGWITYYTGGGYSGYVEYSGNKLVENGGVYTLTARDGSYRLFNSLGLLTARVDSEGNTTTYTYTDADSDTYNDEIATITYPDGKVTNFHYDGSLVDKIQYDYDSGTYQRVVNLEYTSGLMTTLTLGELGQSNPEWNYDYITSGNHLGLLTSVTNPNGEDGEITYTYDFAGRLQTETYPNNASRSLVSLAVVGLADPTDPLYNGSDTSHKAPLVATEDAYATRTDQYGKVTKYTTDGYGLSTYEQDASGSEIVYERDKNGRITRMIEPDPDGDGPLVENITEYRYDSRGNMIEATYSVGTENESYETWQYDGKNHVIRHVDEMGRITTYKVDWTTGLILSMTQVLGVEDSPLNGETDDITTSYVYTNGELDTNGDEYADPDYEDIPHGLLLTETDPLGVITQYDYGTDSSAGSFGLVTAITYAVGTDDEASVQYEYDARSNMVASIDELGRRTEYYYNDLDQLVETRQTTAAAVDDGEADFATAGTWTAETENGGCDGDYKYASGGSGANTAEWTFENLDPNKRYEVLITWVADETNGATDSPFSVHDGDTSTGISFGTTDIDQTKNPVGRAGFDADWQSLGTFTITGDTLTVLLTDDVTDGRVIADAVKLLEVQTSTTYQYDGLGNRTHVTDPSGVVTVTEYCPLGVRTTSVTQNYIDGVFDPDYPDEDVTTTYTYDAGLRLTAVTDQLGNVTAYSYDELGRKIAEMQYDLNELLGYWTLDDAGGSTVVDTSGNENNGTATNVSVADGAVNQAAEFNGTSSYISCGTGIDFSELEAFSAAAWICPHSLARWDGILSNGWGAAAEVRLSWEFESGNKQALTIGDGSSYTTNISTTALQLDVWQHVAFVRDVEGNVTFYLNGVADGGGANARELASSPWTLEIGRNYHGSSYSFDGLMDDVRIYDRALSADEIATLTGTTYKYDDAGQLIRQTDAAGTPTEYRYDSLGRMAETLLPEAAGQTALGSVNYGVFATDAATGTGYIMYSEQNAQDRFSMTSSVSNHLITVIYSSGQWYYDNNSAYVQFTPVASDVLVAEVDFDNDTGAMLEGVDETENGIAKGYFAGDLDIFADRLAGVFDNGDFTVTGTYFITYADAASTAYEYNAAGQLVATTDALGVETRYEYDDLGRQVKVTQNYVDGVYDSQHTDEDVINTYEYDAAGQLISTTDPLGRVTAYTYDALGRVIAERNYSGTGLTGNWNFDEGSGAITGDSSGNDIDGMLLPAESGPTWTDGRYGSALEFDGVDDGVSLETDEALNTEYVTVMFWVKADDLTPASSTSLLNRYNTNPGTISIYHAAGTGKIAFQIRLDGSEGTARNIQSDEAVTAEWTHVATTYDGSTMRLYINGVLQSQTLNVSGVLDTDSFTSVHIGQHPTNGEYYDGLIDDMRIYDRALSADEIAALSVTTYTYDAAGQLISSTDAVGVETRYEYDNLGRMVETIANYDNGVYDGDYPDTDVITSYEYDIAGQLVRQTDPLGNVTAYTYDLLGRVIAERNYSGTGLTGNWNFDEGSGAITGDSSGNDIDGMLLPAESGPAWTDGRYGSALEFDGADDGVSLETDEALNTQYVTVMFWMKASDITPVSSQTLFNRRNTNPGTIAFYYNAGTSYKLQGQIRLDGSEGTGRTIRADSAVTTDWTNVALTYDGSTLKMYINGVLQSQTLTISGIIDTDSFTSIFIGRHETLGEYFSGKIDDVRIYDRALSAEDMAAAVSQKKYAYDAAGQLISSTDPMGVETRYEYDGFGRMTTTIANYVDGVYNSSYTDEDIITTYAYDAAGNMVSVTDPLGATTYYEYDAMGRQTAVILPAADATLSLGSVNYGVLATDAATGTGYIMYSAEDVLVRFPEVNNGDALHASDHLLTVKYFNGQWYYDDNLVYRSFTPLPADVLIAEVDFDADTITSLEGTDTSVNGILAGYDDGDLAYTADWWDGAANDGDFTVEGTWFTRAYPSATYYEYNVGGQLIRQTDPLGNVTAYTYDALGRVVAETQYDPNDLIGYYKLDEGEGTTVADFTGNNPDGTLTPEEGEPEWTEGLYGSALEFDGSNRTWVNNAQINTADGAQNTVSFWMYWDGTSGGMPFCWNSSYDLYLTSGYLGFNTGVGDLIGCNFAAGEWANQWTHITAVFCNGAPTTENVELYINGEKTRPYALLGNAGLPHGHDNRMHRLGQE